MSGYQDYWFSNEVYHSLKWLIPGKLAAGFTPEYSMHNPNWYYDGGIRAILNVSGIIPERKEIEFRGLGMSYMFDKCIKKGRPVFVHCFGGVGRTGTALVAYLLYKGMFKSAKEAILYVRKNYHSGAVETIKQHEALEKFAKLGFWSKFFL